MTIVDSSNSARSGERFIVGMPRAATTWLCKCLNEHPDIAAFGESMFWGRQYVQPAGADGCYTPQQVRSILAQLATGGCLHSVVGDGPGCLKSVDAASLPRLLDAEFGRDVPALSPAELYQRFAMTIAKAEGKPAAVEKTPHHLNWIDRIMGAFPDARIVVMLREPYGFMLSYKHQGDRKPEQLRKLLARLYHPFACAVLWRASMRSALDAQQRWPQGVHIVQQDDVRRDPAATLDAVQRFFGLQAVDLASRVPADNTSFPDGVRPHLAPEDLFWMNLIAGRTMSLAGYERRSTPIAPLRVAWSLLRMPLWAVFCALTLRTRVRGSLFSYFLRWFRAPRGGRSASPVSS